MPQKKRNLSPLSILMMVIVLAAIGTWLIPAGNYNTLSYNTNSFKYSTDSSDLELPFTQNTLDSLQITVSLESFSSGTIRKPVSVPGTYHEIPKSTQGLLDVLKAPILGMMDSIDIILFLLIIGGFMNVFHETGAMVKGLTALSFTMKGREAWLIIILTFLFSFAGASYGMAEEALVFYPIMVPLFLAAGYDLLVPVAVIFGGTQLGTLASFTNPFSTIIASHAAGVNWTDGLNERLLMFVLSTALFIFYTVRYAQKVKKDPSKSLVFKTDGPIISPYENIESTPDNTPLSLKNKGLLLLFLFTFLTMIGGVVFFD